MRTLRITVIFLALTLIPAFTCYILNLRPPGSPATPKIIDTLILIACGLIAAPLTLRLNRWIDRRMDSNEKGKRLPAL